MLTFISCAKTMASHCSLKVPEVTVPYFEAEAVRNALEMSQVSAAELEKLLKVNAKIAAENRARFHDFCSEDNRPMPAIGAYTGAVFKRILPKDFTADDFRYAQEHLRITSFLYGLLRPLDGIRPYRLEGDVRLPEKGGITMFDYWKPLLTDCFIEEIKKRGGILVNLAGGVGGACGYSRFSSMERRKVKDRCHLCEDVQRGDGASHHQKSHWMPRRFERFFVGRFYF